MSTYSSTYATEVVPERPSRLKRFARKTGICVLVLAVVGTFSYQFWKASGSGQWELVRNDQGVIVHTKKIPGDPLVKVKGVGTLDSKLAGIFKLMREAASCEDANCYDSSIIESHDYPKTVYYKFTYPLFFPFKDRDYVVISEFNQDAVTKEIMVDYRAVPDKLPRSECCVRITEMDNKWRFTPLPNGKVEVEFELATSSGGFFPDFVISMGAPRLVHWAILDFQRILNQDKYKNAPADYVQEVGTPSPLSSTGE